MSEVPPAGRADQHAYGLHGPLRGAWRGRLRLRNAGGEACGGSSRDTGGVSIANQSHEVPGPSDRGLRTRV